MNKVINEPVEKLLRAFKASRSYLCLPFCGFEMTFPSEDVLKRLAHQVEERMGVKKVTPKCWRPREYLWMIALFYGDERTYRATYEDGESGSINFVPRQVFYVVLDTHHQYFYVSLPEKRRTATPDFLYALNGTLFEDRAPNAPFKACDFDLEIFNGLEYDYRMPKSLEMPWISLTMAELHYRVAAREGSSQFIYKPSRDGFEDMLLEGIAWPRYVEHMILHCSTYDDQKKKALESVITLYNCSSYLRASLSEKNADAVAELVNLASADRAHVVLL
jgi:hypothetical protein